MKVATGNGSSMDRHMVECKGVGRKRKEGIELVLEEPKNTDRYLV